MKQICVIGLGYIGLPTAAMFASNGVKVYGVDIQKKVVDTINQGKVHIEEPFLGEIVKKCVTNGMLSAGTEVRESDVFIIAVPTPVTEDKKADLKYVEEAARNICPFLTKGNLVILESTVTPGCTENFLAPILEESGLKAGIDFYIAHCPERVLPGNIINELQYNNRIVGGINSQSSNYAKELYSTFVKGEIYLTDATTAELCKLMENTYRDVNIALANELAKICERLGVNVWDVIKYANKHPRVNLHSPGPGVGGHCLAVDPWFIIESSPDLSNIIRMSRETNDSMPYYVYQKIKSILPDGGKIVILGCTYKADVDDVRESPIMKLADLLENDVNYTFEIVDPYVKKYNKNIYECANNSDLVILAVNHKQFTNISFQVLSKIMKGNKILDTRNFFDQETVLKSGLDYYLLGDGSRISKKIIEEVAIS